MPIKLLLPTETDHGDLFLLEAVVTDLVYAVDTVEEQYAAVGRFQLQRVCGC